MEEEQVPDPIADLSHEIDALYAEMGVAPFPESCSEWKKNVLSEYSDFNKLPDFIEQLAGSAFENLFIMPRYLHLIHEIYLRFEDFPFISYGSMHDYGAEHAMEAFMHQMDTQKDIIKAVSAMREVVQPLFSGYRFIKACEKQREIHGVLSIKEAVEVLGHMDLKGQKDLPRTLLQDGLCTLTELDFNTSWNTWRDFDEGLDNIMECIESDYLFPFKEATWTKEQALVAIDDHDHTLGHPHLRIFLEETIDRVLPFFDLLSLDEIMETFAPLANPEMSCLLSTEVCPVLQSACALSTFTAEGEDRENERKRFPTRLLIHTLLRKTISRIKQEQHSILP